MLFNSSSSIRFDLDLLCQSWILGGYCPSVLPGYACDYSSDSDADVKNTVLVQWYC